MIIQCTHCKAKFQIADDKFAQKDEIKARCAKCEQIFPAKIGQNAFPGNIPDDAGKDSFDSLLTDDKHEPAEKVSKDEALSESIFNGVEVDESQKSDDSSTPLSDLAEELSQETEMKEGAPQEFPDSDTAAKPVDVKPPDAQTEHLAPKIKGEVSNGKFVAKIPLKKVVAVTVNKTRVQKRAPTISNKFYFLYPVIIIAAILVGLMLVGVKLSFNNILILKSKAPSKIKNAPIIFDYDSETLKTTSGATLLVISGIIYNNSSKEIKNAFVESELYDDGSKLITKDKFPCCLKIQKSDLYEIENMDAIKGVYKKELLSSLKPYEKSPFTSIFKNPEEAVVSFRINVLNE